MGKWKTEWQLPLHELLTILSVGVGGYRGWSSLGLRIEESRAFLYAYATRPAHVYIFITLSALYIYIYIYISPIPIILNLRVFIPKLKRGRQEAIIHEALAHFALRRPSSLPAC